MKKRMVAIMMAALMAGTMAGCGNKENNELLLKNLDVDAYVTLGEYKGLAVTEDGTPVSDAEVEASVRDAFNRNVTAENGGITDRAVENGDNVNIDYEGKENGVAFAGGTASSQLLLIGSGQFIPGFEEGLVGVMPGETVDLNLTFPEDYNPEMAGKSVVFTVTVNHIVPEEMTDEIVANFGLEGVTNLDEFREAARVEVEYQRQEYQKQEMASQVLNAFMDTCEFTDVPQEMADRYAEIVRTQVEQTAAQYSMTSEDFAKAAYNMDFESLVKEYSMAGVKQDIAMQAVANKENLNITDEELDTFLQEAATQGGFNTVEDFLAENTKEDYRDYLMVQKVMQFLVSNAEVTVLE